MMENFSNLAKEAVIQVQEVQRVSKKRNPKRPRPSHIITKMPNVRARETVLKKQQEKTSEEPTQELP